jgi:hypothetical protein
MKEKESIKLIQDCPVDVENGGFLSFGHSEIGESIIELVEIADKPLTIGLFGGWGTGKSTIISYVGWKLGSKNIPNIVFDVWKHSDDSLRRTFLVELTKQLKDLKSLSENYEVDEHLFSQTQETSNKPIGHTILDKFNTICKHWLTKYVCIIILIIFVSLSFYLINANGWVYGLTLFLQVVLLITTGVTTFISSTAFVYISKILTTSIPENLKVLFESFIPTKSKSIIFDRFQDPHQFESEFSNIISKMVGDKIVITFDNLDRVEPNLLINTLTTIKTFLDPNIKKLDKHKNIIFIIPCDEKSIRRNVEKHYENSGVDSEEYLRKFFNTTFTIPRFMQSELESFTKEKLKITNINILQNSDKVSWLITKAFRENPRQIIQFINLLVGYYILISKRNSELPEDFVKNNIAQLTRYLIVKQLYPLDVDKVLKSNYISFSSQELLEKSDLELGSELVQFLRETEKQVPISSFKLLSSLRRSKLERQLEGIDDLFIALEDNKYNEAKNLFEKISKIIQEDPDKFNIIIKEKVESLINETTKSVFIGGLLKLLNETNTKLSETAYEAIIVLLQEYNIFKNIILEPNIYQSQLFLVRDGVSVIIIDNWIAQLEEMSNAVITEIEEPKFLSIINKLGELKDNLAEGNIRRLKDILRKEYIIKNISLLSSISKNSNIVTAFISNEFVKSIIPTIPNIITQIDTLERIIDSICALDISYVREEDAIVIYRKFYEFLISIQTQPFSEEELLNEERFNKVIIQYIKKFGLPNVGMSVDLVSCLNDGILRVGSQNNSVSYVALFITVLNCINQVEQTFIDAINNFIINGSINAQKRLFNEFQIDIHNTYIFPEVIKRALLEFDYYDFLLGNLKYSEYEDVLLQLLEKDPDRFVIVLNNIKEHYSCSQSIVANLLNKIDVNKADFSKSAFELLISIIQKDDIENKNALQAKISEFLKSTDLNIQSIGAQAISGVSKKLGKARLRIISKEVFDWLKDPNQLEDKFQRISIEIVVTFWNEYNKTEKDQFIQFVFDELIRKRTDVDAIQFGFKILKELKIKYSNSNKNFDDLFAKFESETQDVKKAIVEGLGNLEKSNSKDANEYMEKFTLIAQ